MAGKKPQYKVLVSRQGQDSSGSEKNWYTEVGAGWDVAKGGISLQLHALPTDGRLVIFPRDNDDPQQQ